MSSYHKILIQGDEGDESFHKGASLLLQGLHMVETMRAVPQAASLAHRLHEIYSFTEDYNHTNNNNENHSSHTIQRTLESARPHLRLYKPYLDSILTSFSSLQGVPPSPTGDAATPPTSSASNNNSNSNYTAASKTTLRIKRMLDGGLIVPAEVRLQDFLRSQPLFNYTHYYLFLTEFVKIVSNHLLFSACEPRIKILTSRYELHRSFNSSREEAMLLGDEDSKGPQLSSSSLRRNDTNHTNMDVRRAPKLDVRCLESFMSANTLISFLDYVRLNEPDREVYHSASPVTDNNGCSDSSGNGNSYILTVQEVFARFFGPSYNPANRHLFSLSASALGINTNYADEGSSWERVVDLQSPGSVYNHRTDFSNNNDNNNHNPLLMHTNHHQHLSPGKQLLQYFLNLFNNGNNGELLADLVRYVLTDLKRQRGGGGSVANATEEDNVANHNNNNNNNGHRSSSMDKIELEITITGHSNRELYDVARWCVRAGLVEDPTAVAEGTNEVAEKETKNTVKISDMVILSLRISQFAFEGRDNGKNNHHNNNNNTTKTKEEEECEAFRLGEGLWKILLNESQLRRGEGSRRGRERTTARSVHPGDEERSDDEDEEEEIVLAEHFGDVLYNIFGPIWRCILNPNGENVKDEEEEILNKDVSKNGKKEGKPTRSSNKKKILTAFLKRIASFGISFDRSPGNQEMPIPFAFRESKNSTSTTSSDKNHTNNRQSEINVSDYKLKNSDAPPDAFFAYYVWRNLQCLNCYTTAHHFFSSGLKKNNEMNIPSTTKTDTNSTTTPSSSSEFPSAEVRAARKEAKSSINYSFNYGDGASDGESDHHHSSSSHPDREGPRDGYRANRNNVNTQFSTLSASFGSPFWSYFIPENSIYRFYEPLFNSNQTLKLRLHGGNSSSNANSNFSNINTLFMESVLGLLLADEVVNPVHVFEWSPLCYYYYLTQRCVMLTPSRNKKAPLLIRDTLLKRSVRQSMQVGLNTVIITLEPLLYVPSRDALTEELQDLKKHYYLSNTEVCELCLHGVEQRGRVFFTSRFDSNIETSEQKSRENSFLSEWYAWGIRSWPRVTHRDNYIQYTKVSTLRLRYRETALLHEVELLAKQAIFRSGRNGDDVDNNNNNNNNSSYNTNSSNEVLSSLHSMKDNVLRSVFQELHLDQQYHLADSRLNTQLSLTAKVQLRKENMVRLFFAMNNTLSFYNNVLPEICYGRLLVFFHIPFDFQSTPLNIMARSSSSSSTSLSSMAGSGETEDVYGDVDDNQRYDRLKEHCIQYPRIVVAGPAVDTPSENAKRIARAMVTRHRYQNCMQRCEGTATVTPSFDSNSGGEKKTVMDATVVMSSLSKNSSTTANHTLHDFLHIPSEFALHNGVFDVVLDPQAQASHTTRDYFSNPYRRPMQKGRKQRSAGEVGRDAPQQQQQHHHHHVTLPTWEEFDEDVRQLKMLSSDPVVERYARRRLQMLEDKYQLHVSLTNDDQEDFSVRLPASEAERYLQQTGNGVHMSDGKNTIKEEKDVVSSSKEDLIIKFHPSRMESGDLYQFIKVDVHCHMAGGFTARTLLDFMKRKLESNPDDIVDLDSRTKKPVTLDDLFRQVLPFKRAIMNTNNNNNRVSLDHITIAALDVHAGKHTFNRFDEFNSRYSPMGISRLRSVFLKTDNFMHGRYFAELIKTGCFQKQEEEQNIFSEYRLSIYGRDAGEWDRLARWFVLHGMQHRTNRWMVQVPRLFSLYRKNNQLRNFQEMLTNIFTPLWEVSVYPERNPFLHFFLSHVSGFDSVDNESDREGDQTVFVSPQEWTAAQNPPFRYYMYYMWINLVTLNRYRSSKNLSTFSFRPHAGESGDPDHMADVFFLVDGIGHGINLAYRPVLQYLYYLAQIPLALVPLSNNSLFCKYEDNPFPVFFRRGLQVALATDGALMFHRTEQPLLEEYATAQNFWRLSNADVSEIALASILMSGFSSRQKEAWLGPLYGLRSVVGNNIRKSKVPFTRVNFRYEVYNEEVAYLEARSATDIPNRAMQESREEELATLDLVGLSREDVLLRNFLGNYDYAKRPHTSIRAQTESHGNTSPYIFAKGKL